jgi:hypothetical protein
MTYIFKNAEIVQEELFVFANAAFESYCSLKKVNWKEKAVYQCKDHR